MNPEKETKPTESKPYTLYKQYPSLDAVATLGTDLQEGIKAAAKSPNVGLTPDNGRLFVRVELAITVDPATLPQKETFSFTAPGYDGIFSGSNQANQPSQADLAKALALVQQWQKENLTQEQVEALAIQNEGEGFH